MNIQTILMEECESIQQRLPSLGHLRPARPKVTHQLNTDI